jgi:thioesterase domain-containing protein
VADAEARNPPAVFVLAPPRSGTTLLRVMLGVHPALFAPPELELLSFTTMAARRTAFQGRDSFWLEGVIRAVMEARGCAAGEAEHIVEETERSGWTTRRFYRALQDWIGDRTLVDKTPSYTLDPVVLQRAEDGFAGARYIHLIRHPQATNRSFEQAKLEQIFFRRPHPFHRRQLAELVWTVSHENILSFLAGIPEERRHSVRFEDLVRDPGPVLAALCAFLGLPYRPEMAEPYRPGAARMTDGPHAVSRMLGDVKFLAHGKVDAAAAERWRDLGEPPLGEPTRAVASALGYVGPAARSVPGRGVLVPLNVPRADSGAPVRRPLFCVHPVGGEVAAYRELARRLGHAQPFYGLQSPERPEGPLTGIAEMAAAYLESVRQLQPRGPYRFAGWSLGGLIAYEMACQAVASGKTPETSETPENTELLALIDVASPARLVLAAGRGEPDDAALLIRFARDQAGLFGVEAPAADLAGLDADAVLLRVLEIGRGAGFLAPGIELRDIRRLFERFRVNRRALRSYRPQPYAGDAVLFRAGDRVARMEEGEDPALGWGELISGRLTIVDLPGDHYSILRGGAAQRLADRLLERLAERPRHLRHPG